jgi:hypothetical protein
MRRQLRFDYLRPSWERFGADPFSGPAFGGINLAKPNAPARIVEYRSFWRARLGVKVDSIWATPTEWRRPEEMDLRHPAI